MPKYGGIDFLYLLDYDPPAVPSLTFTLQEFIQQVRRRTGGPGPSLTVVVTLELFTAMKTCSELHVDARFYFPAGDQLLEARLRVQDILAVDLYERLSEALAGILEPDTDP